MSTLLLKVQHAVTTGHSAALHATCCKKDLKQKGLGEPVQSAGALVSGALAVFGLQNELYGKVFGRKNLSIDCYIAFTNKCKLSKPSTSESHAATHATWFFKA